LNCLNRALTTQLSAFNQPKQQVGGLDTLVQILQDAGRSVERQVMDTMHQLRPELAESLRKMMFVFEDLPKLSDLNFQKVLRNVEGKTLSLALKNAPKDVNDLVMRNLSERARTMLESDIASLTRVRASEVEKAQQELVECVRTLIAGGEITLDTEEETEAA
jgi:flagellar motor switch protein FliG